MAESILKLKVDSSDYDSKLRRATSALTNASQSARELGKSFTNASKEDVAFVSALGKMETVAKTSKGKLNELKQTFVELSVQYKSLTDAEKKSPYGKGMAFSIEKLRGRIKNLNGTLTESENALKGNSGALGKLESKLGISIASFTKFASVASLASGALKVAKDAFFSSEANADAWGATIEECRGLYEGFVTSLNNMDISGFLSRMNEISRISRQLYNDLDELQTLSTVRNPERVKLQARQTELKAIIRRSGSGSSAGMSAMAELKALEPLLKKSWENESKNNRDIFVSAVKQRLAQGGINLNNRSFQQLLESFSNEGMLQGIRKNAKGTAAYSEWVSAGGGTYKVSHADTRNVEQKLLDLFTDEWREKWSPYLTASFSAVGQAQSMMLSDARYVKDTASGRKTSSGSTGSASVVKETPTQGVKFGYMGGYSYDPATAAMMEHAREAAQKNALGNDISAFFSGRPIQGLDNTGPTENYKKQNTAEIDLQKTMDKMSTAMSGLTTIMSGIKGLEMELPSGIEDTLNVIQSLMSVIQGVQTVISVFSTSAETANTAAIIANTSALIANTATNFIPFSTGGIPHAQNGIIAGNAYRGDRIPVAVNSREMIINQADQRKLFDKIHGEDLGMNIGNLRGVLSGENIYFAYENYKRGVGL